MSLYIEIKKFDIKVSKHIAIDNEYWKDCCFQEHFMAAMTVDVALLLFETWDWHYLVVLEFCISSIINFRFLLKQHMAARNVHLT